MVQKPLILIDANNVSHIALHSMGELSFLDMKTGVIFGFFIRLLKLWDEFKSNQFIFCWDSRKRFRSAIYPEYKKGPSRSTSTTPEERVIISKQMEELRCEILPTLGFKNILHQTGYEADDLITKAVLEYKREFIVVSTDKDLFQLLTVAACHFIYNTVTGKKMTRDLFQKTYQIEPFEWVKVKALAGDPSDNISGVPGIGEKSAIAFVLDELKGKKLQDIHKARDIIERNLKLVRLPYNQPGFPLTISDLQPDDLSVDRFIDIFDHYGFQSFLRSDKLDKWKGLING